MRSSTQALRHPARGSNAVRRAEAERRDATGEVALDRQPAQ